MQHQYTQLENNRGSTRKSTLEVVLCLLLIHSFSSVYGFGFDCSSEGGCGLPGDGAYPYLVLGTVMDVADGTEAEAIYNWARKQGYWENLPDAASAFTEAIQVMSVEIPVEQGEKQITLLMGRKDYDAVRIAPGDFVRHTPHPKSLAGQPGYANGPKDAYWEIFGCIAVLCRVDDIACPARYRPGVYSLDGMPMEPGKGMKSMLGVPIDPVTYLPVVQSPQQR